MTRHTHPGNPLLAATLALAFMLSLPSPADAQMGNFGEQVQSIPGRAQAAAQAQADRILNFVDRLPGVTDFALPDITSSELIQVYANPHIADLWRRDFLRLPVGFRTKIRGIEGHAEVQSYFTHGLGDPAGYGFSGILVGAKREIEFLDTGDAAWSVGVNFSTPLSRPPMELTDGFRHTRPFLAATFPIVRAWKVTGFSTFGANLLASTSLPANFGHNQLHSNSVSVTLGAAREFARFQVAASLTHENAVLASDETGHVTSFRPTIIMPLDKGPMATSRILLTLGAAAVHGPDGDDFGVSSRVRVEIDLKRTRRAQRASAPVSVQPGR